MFVEAVLWIVRTGSPWRDLPDVFGEWNSIFRRFSRWSRKGVWWRILAAMSNDPDFEYLIVVSTVTRLRELANERRRFGDRRLAIVLKREGVRMNLKKVYRLYREQRLVVRRRGGRKRALGTRASATRPAGSEPALAPRLRVRGPERRPALQGVEHRRRLHPRMPGGGGHLALRHPRCARAQ
ncbi:hypothetical protein CHELA1G11_10312 [Hyphomicrobiales bacterium]|nr:hypothetical protein CHELA1G11_10312 [Hyphomicrobiales bacterium]CAH1675560.1 hypothetical protein CHELA1G2_13993 [Hyphomicrobiales bacterium]